MAAKLSILISWVNQPVALDQQGGVVAQWLVHLPLVLEVLLRFNPRLQRGNFEMFEHTFFCVICSNAH